MKLTKESRLVMMGDSITDCGRKRPVGEGGEVGWGNGYVNLVVSHLAAEWPEYLVHILNMGISGNTVRDLKARWQTDCLDLQPDWVSIMIGINDVWRQFDRPYQKGAGVPLKEYKETLEELIVQTKPLLSGGLILVTPYYIESNKADPMRKCMDEFGACVKSLAKKHKTIFVDTQAAFDKTLKHTYSASIAKDRVHPITSGHTIIANAFLRAIGAMSPNKE